MIVIADTSPIINLAAIGKLDLLPQIFTKIIIPQAVFEEITIKGVGEAGSEEIKTASWISVKTCNDNASRFTHGNRLW